MDRKSQTRESGKPGQRDQSLIRSLSEPSRFCCAAVCATSMGNLYPEPENRTFCQSFTSSLVTELALPDHVQPIMESFATGHGSEGMASFVEQISSDPALEIGSIQLCQDLLTFALRDGCYDARARVSIRHIAQLLHVSNAEVDSVEEQLVQSLCAALPENEADKTSRLRHEKKKKFQRYFLIGLATAVGGTVIGLTGGLAAPLVAAGAGAVIGGAGAAALGSVAGIAIMTSLFGAAGAGLAASWFFLSFFFFSLWMFLLCLQISCSLKQLTSSPGYKMKKRIGKIEEFEFIPLTPGSTLHLTIAITGWLSAGKYGNFQAPWSNLQQSQEQYCLVWESQYLLELGNAFESIINGLVNMAAQEALKFTVLSGLIAALAWPASLITAASLIDNPWAVCVNRAAEAGKQLARVLLSREQGQRPVSLIGFSLGARVIFYCLQEMSKAEGGAGLVEDVVLLGAPAPGSASHWQSIVNLVAGRIVNGYCRGDWLLKFLYRSSSAELSVAGLQPLELENHRIFNVNLTTIVEGHLDYNKKMDVILKTVGVKTREVLAVESGGLGQLVCRPGDPEKATAAEHLTENMQHGMEKQEEGVWVNANVSTNENEVQEMQKGKEIENENHGIQKEIDDEKHGMQKEIEDEKHGMQKETEDEKHGMQKETEDEHIIQKEIDDEKHVIQKETEDEKHGMQKEIEDEKHGMQKETEDEKHVIQKEIEDEKHEIQKETEDEKHVIQKEIEDEKHGMQKETEDEHIIQKEIDDEKHGIQKEIEDEKHVIQKEIEDEKHGMQKETEDEKHVIQKEVEDEKHVIQKEVEDEHEMQKGN